MPSRSSPQKSISTALCADWNDESACLMLPKMSTPFPSLYIIIIIIILARESEKMT